MTLQEFALYCTLAQLVILTGLCVFMFGFLMAIVFKKQ